MKTFPGAYTVEKNKQFGAKPIWIDRITINSVDYFLAGKSLSIPSFTGCDPWPESTAVTAYAAVESFDSISIGVSGAADEYQVMSTSATYLLGVNLPTYDLEYLATTYNLEQCPYERYAWYDGCSDPPQIIFSGRVQNISSMDDTTLELDFQDYSIDLENYYVGDKVSSTTYASALEDDVGEVIPLPFGTVVKIPCLCLHSSAPYVYIFSGRPVTSVSAVYARPSAELADIDITSYCTTYTGQTGSELTGYEDLGVISITADQAAQIQALVQASISLGSHSHTTDTTAVHLYFDNTVTYSGVWQSGHDYDQAIDGDETTTYAQNVTGTLSYAEFSHEASISESGTPSYFRIAVKVGPYSGYNGLTLAYLYRNGSLYEELKIYEYGANFTYYSGWYPCSGWSDLEGSSKVKVRIYWHNYAVYETWVETNADTTSTDASPATGVEIVNPDPKSDVADMVLVSCVADSGTPTGIADWILDQAGLDAISTSGTITVPTFNGLISEYKTALDWLNQLAWECGAFFVYTAAGPKFISRLGSGYTKSIPAVIIDTDGKRSLTRKKTDNSYLIDIITALYDRDWSQSDSYKKTYSAGSGTHESPDLFKFDFITSATYAAALVILYLSQYNEQKWVAEFDVPLLHSELEFGDTAVLSFLNGETGIVTSAELDLNKITLKVRY